MSTIAELKKELKALNLEYAKIKDLPKAERAEFGRQINAKKQAIEAQIAEAEAAAEAVSVRWDCPSRRNTRPKWQCRTGERPW